MPSDNHVSSILLLILIGLAIYFLLNSKDNFTNKLENFDSTSMVAPYSVGMTAPYSVGMTAPNTMSQQYNVNKSVMNYGSIDVEQDLGSSQDVEQAPVDTGDYSQTVPPPVYDPNTFNKNVEFSMPAPISENDVVKPPKVDASLFDFTPHDDSISNEGVSLSDAFSPPLPPGTNSDLVDFKKGNMDHYDAKDFLPKDINDEWFETDFSLAKYQLNDDKLINTERYIIGINTVGQSLKNASYDIRGTIPNPKFVASPWNQSTYEPDFNLKPLC
jgi:hypothetical protein